MSNSNNNNKPIMWSEFAGKFDQIRLKDPENNKAGGVSVFATIGEPPQLLCMQLTNAPKRDEKPDAYLPFGISKPYGQGNNPKEEKEDNNNRKSVDIAVTNPKVFEVIEKFEEWSIKKLAEESKRFFGKQLKEEQVMQKMKSSIKRDENAASNYPPRLRTKMNVAGPFAVKVSIHQGDKRVPGTWNALNQKGSGCLPILRFGGYWFASGSWGPSWEIQQVLIYPRTSNDTLEFHSDGGDIPPMEESAPATPVPPVPAPSAPQQSNYDFSLNMEN